MAAAPVGASLFAILVAGLGYRAELGGALLAVSTVILLGIVVWVAVSLLRRAAGERRHAEEALRASERRYRELFEDSPAYLCTHDADGILLSVNPAAAEALGYSPEELVGRNLAEMVAEPAGERFGEYLSLLQAQGRQEGLLGIRTRSGENRVWLYGQRWMEEEGEPPYALGHALDVTERRRAEQEIARQAFHDSLTGLANRALFEDRLTQAVAHANRRRQRLAVFYVDLDGFKPINDTYGHATGDRVLREVGARLLRCVRKVDTVARMGGDEFCLLILDVRRPTDAVRLGEGILETLAEPFDTGREPLRITASLGISLYPESASNLDELLARADRALYMAKAAGPGHLHLA